PSYFSPANYRIFAKVDPSHNWNGLIDQCYTTLAASPGASKGLTPDWMVPDGNYFNGSLGYNAFRSGKSMYKDAIRVHWRLAMDYLWFGEARAKRLLDAAGTFIATPDRANFYTMDGVVLPATDTFTLGNGEKRSRREHSELTVGMWACAAFASAGPEASKPWADTLLGFIAPGSDRWGRAADLTLPDRSGSTPNEEYFEQYLAWFGAAILAGRFSNIWEDLKKPLPTVGLPPRRPAKRSGGSGSLGVSPLGKRLVLRTEPAATVRWLSVSGAELGRSRADGDGRAEWDPPQGHAGIVLARVAGQADRSAFLPPTE
ncbi:MAG: glycosyl hydrolase family 8, partial [Fibrobacteria bacterium]